MLVEDNPDDEARALRALRRNDLRNPVVIARDAAEALDPLFAVDKAEPAVILLDLKLPKIDGLEVLRRIRSPDRTRLAPVVVLTPSRDHRDVAASYRLGANSGVRKPVHFDAFLAAARSLVLYWLQRNQVPPAALDP